MASDEIQRCLDDSFNSSLHLRSLRRPFEHSYELKWAVASEMVDAFVVQALRI